MKKTEQYDSPDIMDTIYERARSSNSTIILAESEDERVLKATQIIEKEHLANLILLNSKSFQSTPEVDQNIMIDIVKKAYSKENLDDREVREKLTNDTKVLAATLVKMGKASGYVGGNLSATPDTIRPALKIIETSDGFASSFFLMSNGGKNLFFADCGFNQNPNPEQLARIAVDTANNVANLGIEPKVAFLSFSTAGSASSESVSNTREAIAYAKKIGGNIQISPDELQFDAAIDTDVAARKAPNSEVAGRANVLVFPDLNSGNIAYKVLRFGGWRAVGPIMQGFKAPVNDLSRSCSVQDIVDVVAFTAMQSAK